MALDEVLAVAVAGADRVLVRRGFGADHVPDDRRPETALAVRRGRAEVDRALQALRTEPAAGAVLRVPEVEVAFLRGADLFATVGLLVPVASSPVWPEPVRLVEPGAVVAWFDAVGVPGDWGRPTAPTAEAQQRWASGDLDDEYRVWRSVIEALAPDLDPAVVDRLCLLGNRRLLPALARPIPAVGDRTLGELVRQGDDAMVERVLGRWEEIYGSAR